MSFSCKYDLDRTRIGKGLQTLQVVEQKICSFVLCCTPSKPDGEYFVVTEYEVLSIVIEKDVDLSPDEDFQLREVYVTSAQLMAYELTSGKLINLSGDELVEDDDPVFSPDGNWLVFSRRMLDEATIAPGRQLWLMSADGSQQRQITDEPEYKYMDFAWSPDGVQVAAVRASNVDHSEPTEIWIFDLENDTEQEIVIGGYRPKWIK